MISGRVLRVPAEVLRERAQAWFPFGAHLIAGLYRTARSIESTARQRETLVTLGTLAAGLAHEINNPASAATRAVDVLEAACQTLLTSVDRLASDDISSAQFAALEALRRAVEHPTVDVVSVIGGHEEESENGVSTLDSDFLTVLIRSFRDCDGNFVNDRGSGPAEFTFSPSLQTATVDGTITTRDGRTVSADMAWEGTGPVETTTNTTTFPGFTGLFVGQQRDAVATGTVVVDGDTAVDGSTTNAEIETLEDTNISHP